MTKYAVFQVEDGDIRDMLLGIFLCKSDAEFFIKADTTTYESNLYVKEVDMNLNEWYDVWDQGNQEEL